MAAAVRGCGERVAGGLYLVAPMGPDGRPVDDFIIDPPQIMDLASAGVSPIGSTIVARQYETASGRVINTHYVLDVVGKEHYPNVADFVEEVRRFGLSRRIARSADFSLLDQNSRIVLLHERAHIVNSESYHAQRDPERFWCPRDIPKHMQPDFRDMCASLWWEDVTGGMSVSDERAPDGKLTHGERMKFDQPGVQMHLQRQSERAVVRTMPSFQYRGLHRPVGIVPAYRYAAFATFPIGKIEVVRDTAGGSHTSAIERARMASGITVEEVNE